MRYFECFLLVFGVLLCLLREPVEAEMAGFDPLNPLYIEGRTVFCTASMSDVKYYKGGDYEGD